LTPGALLAVVPVFVVMVAWTRHISMGSIVGAAVFPLAVWLIVKPDLIVVLAAIVASAFIIWRHGSNLQRLRHGTEREFSFGSRKN
jgi:glycerol-3-phosphate acyltransferase PlsY